MSKKNIAKILLISSLLANVILGLAFFAYAYRMGVISQNQQDKSKIVSFTNLFIEKVLVSNQEVDFDTRLTLETMVRDLHDEEIFNQWQKFTQTASGVAASAEAKKLLSLLAKKTSILP